MKKTLSMLALSASALVATPFAQAQNQGSGQDGTLFKRATASGPSESPPNSSLGYSVSTFELDGNLWRVEVPFQELASPTVTAHIHCCTSTPFQGVAPVALPFVDFPVGVTGGKYTHAFDLTDEMTYEPAFLAQNGGTASQARQALINGINAHEAYMNIHTSQYPNGEIRGFLVTAPIPEPSSWAMLGFGLVGLGLMARRRV